MKKLVLTIAIIASGSVYSNTIPGPFWYNISEKILAEAHQLISPEPAKATVKTKVVKAPKVTKTTLKCESKKEPIVQAPYFTITGNGMWIVN